MAKIDLKAKLKHLYSASAKKPELVEVMPMNYLMIDGFGDPNAAEFQQAMEALYAVSYAIKFKAKKAGDDFTVMPPESLFWSDDPQSFCLGAKDAWKWTLMVAQPAFVSGELVQGALREAEQKKGLKVEPRFEALGEGTCAQIMHIGPYSEEYTTIKMLHDFIHENGYDFNGKHHEIYLSDPRRAKPEKMKTIIRQPVKILSPCRQIGFNP